MNTKKLSKYKAVINNPKFNIYVGIVILLLGFCSIFFEKFSITFLILMLLSISIFFVFNSFENGLSLILFLTPFVAFNLQSFPVSICSMYSLIFIAVYGIKYLINILIKKFKIQKSSMLMLLVLCLYGFLNFNLNEFPLLITNVLMLLLLYLAFTFANEQRLDITRLSKSFLYGLISSVISSCILYLFTTNNLVEIISENRFQALCQNPNTLQVFCTIALSLILVYYFKKEISLLNFILSFIFFAFVGIYTLSKSFFISLIFLILIFFAINIKRYKNKGVQVTMYTIVIALVAILIFRNLLDSIFERFFRYGGENMLDKLLTGRYAIWQKYLYDWIRDLQTIVFGVGITQPAIYYLGPHSTYIGLLHKYGLFGITLIFMFIHSLLLNGNRQPFLSVNKIPILILLVIFLVENLINLYFLPVIILCLYYYSQKDENKFIFKLQKI